MMPEIMSDFLRYPSATVTWAGTANMLELKTHVLVDGKVFRRRFDRWLKLRRLSFNLLSQRIILVLHGFSLLVFEQLKETFDFRNMCLKPRSSNVACDIGVARIAHHCKEEVVAALCYLMWRVRHDVCHIHCTGD